MTLETLISCLKQSLCLLANEKKYFISLLLLSLKISLFFFNLFFKIWRWRIQTLKLCVSLHYLSYVYNHTLIYFLTQGWLVFHSFQFCHEQQICFLIKINNKKYTNLVFFLGRFFGKVKCNSD